MATTGATQLENVLKKAEAVLVNRDLYVPSNELEKFKTFLSHAKQAQGVWAEALTAQDRHSTESEQGEAPSDDLDPPAQSLRAWETLDKTADKLDEEIDRINKLRFDKELTGLLVCCKVKNFRPVNFPQDLVDCFNEVVQDLDPHQNLNRLVSSLQRTLRRNSKSEPLQGLLKDIEAELLERQNGRIGCGGKNKISLMHRASFDGISGLLRALMSMKGRVSNINCQDSDGQTPLHYATIAGQTEAIRALLTNKKVQANREDYTGRTALQIAVEMNRKDIEKLLMDHSEVQQYVDRLSADRQVYVDAANAILVGASLIASVTFGSWLSPPLGFVNYYNIPAKGTDAPSDANEMYAAVETYASVRIFWTLNSLSFFFSLATIIVGAGCALPMPDAFIEKQVAASRRVVVVASSLLVLSINFVLGAFAAAGYAALPPVPRFQTNMTVTVTLGSLFCMMALFWFSARLYLIRPAWWRRIEQDMMRRVLTSRAGKEMRIEREQYFIS